MLIPVFPVSANGTAPIIQTITMCTVLSLTVLPFKSFQLSYIAEDENGKIVGYVLAKM